jgi:hypothetical protein
MCLACLAYAQDLKKSPTEIDRELEQAIGRPLPNQASDLEQCQVRVREWETWAAQNMPICQQWERENSQIHRENLEIKVRIGVAFAGLGAGLFLAFMALKAIRRWWPQSKTRRQLITLLLMAAWVTVVSVVAISDVALSHHPINLAVMVFVYSLPALAFGGVGVWWFGRTKPEILW